jgi:HSP20 family protein
MKLAEFGTETLQRLSKRPMPNLVDRRQPGFASENKKPDSPAKQKLNMNEMEEMQNRLASLFGGRLPLRKRSREEGFPLTEWTPVVDIAEDDKEYTISAELPGLNKEDVKATVEGGVFSITGERKVEEEEKNKNYHRIERSYGTFTRSFTLPEGVSSDKISAEFKDGVLKVHLPKDEKVKPKSIDVKIV